MSRFYKFVEHGVGDGGVFLRGYYTYFSRAMSKIIDI